MGALVFLFAIFSSVFLAPFLEAVEPTQLRCERAIQHEVRIQGCQQQPCTIRRGVALPFEVDFTFTGPPVEPDQFDFKTCIGFYGYNSGSYYGYYLSNYTCKDGQCGNLCPNKKYTFKNPLYVYPNSTCRASCDEMNADGTGKKNTSWKYYIRDSRSNATDRSDRGSCEFYIKLNITN